MNILYSIFVGPASIWTLAAVVVLWIISSRKDSKRIIAAQERTTDRIMGGLEKTADRIMAGFEKTTYASSDLQTEVKLNRLSIDAQKQSMDNFNQMFKDLVLMLRNMNPWWFLRGDNNK